MKFPLNVNGHCFKHYLGSVEDMKFYDDIAMEKYEYLSQISQVKMSNQVLYGRQPMALF